MSLSDYSSDSDGEAAILHGEVQEAKTAAFRDRRGAEDGTSVSDQCRNPYSAGTSDWAVSVHRCSMYIAGGAKCLDNCVV